MNELGLADLPTWLKHRSLKLSTLCSPGTFQLCLLIILLVSIFIFFCIVCFISISILSIIFYWFLILFKYVVFIYSYFIVMSISSICSVIFFFWSATISVVYWLIFFWFPYRSQEFINLTIQFTSEYVGISTKGTQCILAVGVVLISIAVWNRIVVSRSSVFFADSDAECTVTCWMLITC